MAQFRCYCSREHGMTRCWSAGKLPSPFGLAQLASLNPEVRVVQRQHQIRGISRPTRELSQCQNVAHEHGPTAQSVFDRGAGEAGAVYYLDSARWVNTNKPKCPTTDSRRNRPQLQPGTPHSHDPSATCSRAVWEALGGRMGGIQVLEAILRGQRQCLALRLRSTRP